MAWKDDTSPADLRELLESGQKAEARDLIYSFVESIETSARSVDSNLAKQVTTLLRNYTFFDELEDVARCILKFADDNVGVHLQLAQALIERKRITAAIDKLFSLRERLEQWAQSGVEEQRDEAGRQLPEVVGLLGRSYKQLYVNDQPNKSEMREYDLGEAIKYYRQSYEDAPERNYWQGINWAALLTVSERIKAGNPMALSRDAKAVAATILANVGDEQYWEIATRMEAHLACGQTLEAIDACKRCLALDHPEVDRFKLSGTIRQLEELWQLNENEAPGNQILTPMKIRLAQLPGGTFVVDPQSTPIDRDELQRVWGGTKYRPIEWLDAALNRARAVARIGTSVHSGHGTGFLVDGKWFSNEFSDKSLLLTNAHVCSPDPKVRHFYGALSPEQAVVAFLASNDKEGIRGKVVFSSPPDQLDATLLELERAPAQISAPRLGLASVESEISVMAGQRLSIIGHPHGGGMQISIQDNETKQVGETYLWYQTPTDPGSSGSPVFDDDWRLVGLHHASKSVKKANEGVRIDRILEAIRGELKTTKVKTGGVNPWDVAHENLQAGPELEAVSTFTKSAELAPNIEQTLEVPPSVEGAAETANPKGLDRFWPPEDENDYHFGWHLGGDYSQLRDARNEVGNPGDGRIRIGILDTGYDPNHVTTPDFVNTELARNLTGEGDPTDAVDRSDDFFNNKGHGTATLALLAGAMVEHPDLPGGRDYLGGAPFLEVVPIRIADSVVHFNGDAMAEGIKYATECGCRVVSISMGGVANQRWADAVNAAYEAGVVIVAAAGNRFGPSPPSTMVFPARFHRVIAACGATFDKTAYYQRGIHRNMQGCFGPQGRMSSAIAAFTPNTPWATFGQPRAISNNGAGTSSATPQVAAAAALWLQKHMPTLPATDRWRCVEAVRHALFTSADEKLPKYFGNGLLRAKAALSIAPKLDLPQAEPAEVRFRWLRLVLGLEGVQVDSGDSPPTAREHLLESEALQLYLTSAEMQDLADGADPSEDLAAPTKIAVLEVMRGSARTSRTLRERLDHLLDGP